MSFSIAGLELESHRASEARVRRDGGRLRSLQPGQPGLLTTAYQQCPWILNARKDHTADTRDDDCAPHYGPAWPGPVCPNRSLDRQLVGDHCGAPLEAIVLG